jgi:hypothetical protein
VQYYVLYYIVLHLYKTLLAFSISQYVSTYIVCYASSLRYLATRRDLLSVYLADLKFVQSECAQKTKNASSQNALERIYKESPHQIPLPVLSVFSLLTLLLSSDDSIVTFLFFPYYYEDYG